MKVSISIDNHDEHHKVLARWIENDNLKAARREKWKAQVGGWLIISILAGLGNLAYQAFIYLKEHLK